MKTAALPSLILALSLAACGGGSPSPARPAATGEPAAQASAAPSAASSAAPDAGLSPREKSARKYAAVIKEPDVDAEQQGRLAMNGLSEPQFGLPASLRKAMEAVTGQSVDPSQLTTILMAGLSETKEAKDALAQRCGKPFDKFAEGLK